MAKEQELSTVKLIRLVDCGLDSVELGIGVSAAASSPFASAKVQPQQTGGQASPPQSFQPPQPNPPQGGTAPAANNTET